MIKISDIENQRAQAGVTIKTPTYSPRVAEANAARQEMQRAQSLQQQGGSVQTYIDPATGKDTRSITGGGYTPVYEGAEPGNPMGNGTIAYYQPIEQSVSGGTLSTVQQSGPLTTRTSGGFVAAKNLQNIAAGQNFYGVDNGATRQEPGASEVLNQANLSSQGLRSQFNQPTGGIRSDTTPVVTGQIDVAARDRLVAAGMTPEQANQKIMENRAAVQGAFNQVGTGSAQNDFMTKLAEEANRRNPGNQEGANAYIKSVLDMEASKAALQKAQTPEAVPTAPGVVPESTPAGTGTAGAPVTPATPSTPIDPNTAGAGAAFANLPPEAQFLAPYLQQFQDTLNKSIADNAQFTQGMLGNIEKTYGGIQGELDAMKQGYMETTEGMNELLKEVRDNNQETIAAQEKAANDKLAWDEYKQRTTLSKQKREAHDAMVAQIALAGGFGQDAGMRAVMESDAEYESKMSDLAIQFSYARTDLAAKFTGLYNENQNNYVNGTIENVKELRGALERIGLQSIANKQAKQQAEQGVLEKAWNNQTNLRTTLAKQNLDTAWQIQGLIKDAKQEELDKEDRALSQITKLLNDFPESEVRDLVLELGKNVKSFSVEKMLNAKSKEEIKAAQAAAAARKLAIDMELAKKKNAPLETYDDFTSKKIAQKEQELGQTMSEKARQEFLKANDTYFQAEYDQYSAPNFENITSGNPNIDAAADAYMRGDLTVKDAAKAYGVSVADVTTYTGILRNEGSKIGDIRALEPEQRKELATLRSSIKTSDITKKLDSMKMAVPKIDIASDAASGVGDVALLNFYQNGIVDPGLAVRAEDQKLLMKAAALRDKVNRDYAEGVLLGGESFPQATRDEMARIANEVYEATARIYDDQVYQPVIENASQSGIGEAYFSYLKRSKTNPGGNNADSYVDSFLP